MKNAVSLLSGLVVLVSTASAATHAELPLSAPLSSKVASNIGVCSPVLKYTAGNLKRSFHAEESFVVSSSVAGSTTTKGFRFHLSPNNIFFLLGGNLDGVDHARIQTRILDRSAIQQYLELTIVANSSGANASLTVGQEYQDEIPGPVQTDSAELNKAGFSLELNC
ncbi:MAG: hypothetical protein DCC75_00520 [Proteobacteria bacterium]|nr:MAG: hypothetical protein DCC75_00520 [Pseudomonadota bacterium]